MNDWKSVNYIAVDKFFPFPITQSIGVQFALYFSTPYPNSFHKQYFCLKFNCDYKAIFDIWNVCKMKV